MSDNNNNNHNLLDNLLKETNWETKADGKCDNCHLEKFIESSFMITYDGINCSKPNICRQCLPSYRLELRENYLMVKEYLPALVYYPKCLRGTIEESIKTVQHIIDDFDEFEDGGILTERVAERNAEKRMIESMQEVNLEDDISNAN